MRFARCQADINSVVHKTGAKYSVLLQLPYYDAVRFVIIDPMHNLFLGLAKTKISSGFGGFTADQWKNWVIYYSAFALKGILPQEHYDAWMCFVTACRLICCQTVTIAQCSEAESKIIEFCKHFEKLYGPELCTPNMHLSCHLVDCIRDYGPVYSFWCFLFERYNGILGSYHKNNHNIGEWLSCAVRT